MKKIRFATIGTSNITRKFLQVLGECPEVALVATYSRDINKAASFGKEYGACKFYDDLKELSQDDEIDAVYIASPNAFHCTQAIMLLSAGKHVLCEKALASNSREVQQMYEAAHENNVMLLEAVRTVFDPGMAYVKNNLYKLGEIRQVSFNFCQYSSRYDSFLAGENHNIFSRECSAGALMDIGVYCLHALVELFKEPSSIACLPVKIRGDIDGAGAILAGYDTMVADIRYSKINDSDLASVIEGEAGTMEIPNIHTPDHIKIIYRHGSQEEIYNRSAADNNMIYELQEFIRLIKEQDYKACREYELRSRQVMKIMDDARRQGGIIFLADE